jgi:hypothetical protein
MNRSLEFDRRKNAARVIAGALLRILAASAMVIGGFAATTTAATAATAARTVDYTCHKQNEGIYTCQWFRISVVNTPQGKDTQFVTWASMKDGHVNREIIEIRIYWKETLVSAPDHGETGLDVKGGTGTISANMTPRLCNAEEYRPAFRFKYFEPKPTNKWVYGWSYGAWLDVTTANIKPCHGLSI